MGPNQNGHQVSQLLNIIKQVLSDLSNKSVAPWPPPMHATQNSYWTCRMIEHLLSICFVIPQILVLIYMNV
jgi:hypothetical protein